MPLPLSPGLAELFVGLCGLLAGNKATSHLLHQKLQRQAASGDGDGVAAPCEITLLLLARAKFLASLNQEAEGIRYRGAGCTMIWLKPFAIGADKPKTVEMQYLYRTADGFHFLLNCGFSLVGEKGETWKFWIAPMTRHEARQWALKHADGRDVSHV